MVLKGMLAGYSTRFHTGRGRKWPRPGHTLVTPLAHMVLYVLLMQEIHAPTCVGQNAIHK